MAEYIKRDVVMNGIMGAKWMDGYDGAMAMEIAALAPAADVATVVHGRWERHSSSWYCNRCGIGYRITCGNIPENRHNYCPNCGVKMDEKDKKQ